MRGARQTVECKPPGQHGDDEQAQRRHERPRIEGDRRNRHPGNGNEDGRGTRSLQEPHDQLPPRLDDREVVQIVVIEGELAECRHDHEPPQKRPRAADAVDLPGQGDRTGDQHDLEGKDGQAASRDVAVENLHDVALPPTSLRSGRTRGTWPDRWRPRPREWPAST